MTNVPETATEISLTGNIVSAYVANNRVAVADLPTLIRQVHESLHQASHGDKAQAAGERPKPAVSLRRSVTPDFIICLEDGAKLKMLKRHLRTHYGLTPQQYREKWGLPADYPMVAPNYAERRSALAKQIGLGAKGAGAARRRRAENSAQA